VEQGLMSHCLATTKMAGRLGLPAEVCEPLGQVFTRWDTVAFLVAVGAAESGRPTLMFLTKEAVRIAIDGTATGVACEGCPPLADLLKRYEAAGGRYYVCPICFTAKNLSQASLIGGAELQGTLPLWAWIGDEAATTFSY
jgi:predicted peroxiredoxin